MTILSFLAFMGRRTKTIRVALLGSLISMATTVSADYVCSVSLGLSWSQDTDYDQLIIREGGLGIRAVLMSEYTTRTYDCVTDGIFKYECYGFMGKPFAAPTQLNIKDTKEGAIVVSTTLNLGFLKDYANDQYEAINTVTRRFSIDTYTIQSCD